MHKTFTRTGSEDSCTFESQNISKLHFTVDKKEMKISFSRLKCAAILGAFAKMRKATINSVMSVCPSLRPSVRPHGTTRLPLDRFSLTLICEYFSKICLENPSVFKI
jgi:hypothetical protein